MKYMNHVYVNPRVIHPLLFFIIIGDRIKPDIFRCTALFILEFKVLTGERLQMSIKTGKSIKNVGRSHTQLPKTKNWRIMPQPGRERTRGHAREASG